MECIIEGCREDGRNKFGVRLRFPNTNAVWSPNTGVGVCDYHASQGMRVVVFLEPTTSGEVER